MKFLLLGAKILPANVDLVVFDPLDYIFDSLAHFSGLHPQILLKQHMKHLKSTLPVGYPPTLTIYELSLTQSEYFARKCGFSGF